MSEYNQMIKRQRKWMLYLLAIFVLGAGFSPVPNVFHGLLLGGVVSFYNLWNLQRNISRFGHSVVDNNRPKIGIGTFTRLASAGLAVVVAIQLEEYVNLIGVIVGLMISYIVMLVEFGIRTFTQEN